MTGTIAAEYDIVVEQGATFTLTIVWSDDAGDPQDLTGQTARMQARPGFRSDTVWFEATTENDGITLDTATGTVSIIVPASVTAEVPAPATGVFDLELETTATGFVRRLVRGKVFVTPEVTR